MLAKNKNVFNLVWIYLFISVICSLFSSIVLSIINVESIKVFINLSASVLSYIVFMIYAQKKDLLSKSSQIKPSPLYILDVCEILGMTFLVNKLIVIIKNLLNVAKVEDNIYKTDSMPILFFYIIIIIIFIPIFEELIFRNILLKNLATRTSDKTAILITSFLFSLIHSDFNTVVSMFVFSLFACYFSLKYNNIIISIIAHSIFNIINFTQLMIFDNSQYEVLMIALYILIFALIIIAIYCFNIKIKSGVYSLTLPKKTSFAICKNLSFISLSILLVGIHFYIFFQKG